MQDLSPNQIVPGPRPAPTYHIRPKDNLYVGIATPDQDLSKMTDPTSNGVPLAMAYEAATSKAVNGNIVDSEGNIMLPMLGKIPVAGLTTAEAEDTIRAISRQYLKDAAVKVRLLSYKLTVLGEVKMPGIYYNYNNYITVLDAISLAQGTTDYAKLADVLVLRPTTGGTRTYSLNLNSKSAIQSPAWYLQPDDVVILQPGKNKGLQQKLPFVGIIVGSLSALLLLLNYLKL
ncbi:MAG TPA: polysaccharide biosynthesis/export family protein [Puia sp.]|jgi:polysaccharide export outer membrane protein|nr:polysaccharide biosynthesis/export family protein [Puia sp.]